MMAQAFHPGLSPRVEGYMQPILPLLFSFPKDCYGG